MPFNRIVGHEGCRNSLCRRDITSSMEDKKARKLESHLAGPLDTECSIVYLLSEIRKSMDRDGLHRSAFALRMYCHWSLHVNLDKQTTTQAFLQRVDKLILKKVSPGGTATWPIEYQDDGTFSLLDEHQLIRDFVFLDTFRRELKGLLDSYKLPISLCDDDSRWYRFLSAYASVIEDGELSISGKATALRAVKRVVFRKGGSAQMEGPHLPFTIQWDIFLQDGRICQTEVEANSGGKMISHALHCTGISNALQTTPPREE